MEIKINVPENAGARLENGVLTLKGAKGECARNFRHPSVSLSQEGAELKITASTEKRKDLAVAGTWKAQIKNMLYGVNEGYKYRMKIVYVHFPMTVKTEGDWVIVNNFMGEKGKRKAKIVGDTQVKVQKEEIELTGANKDDVGQTAANIEKACRKKKKDVRIFHDGIYITHKG